MDAPVRSPVAEPFAPFLQSLDADTQEVIRAMDAHESLGHDEDNDHSRSMIAMVAAVYERIDELARKLAYEEPAARDRHLETMLLILSFAPNAQSYWFIRELIDRQPAIYEYLFSKVVAQKPLQMSGKLLRERLMFYIAREQVVNFIFSNAGRTAVMLALEGLKRDKKSS